MATIEEVGKVIHVLRVIQSLSQGDLAEVSGVRNSSISNYERGKAIPKLETLQKLAEGMGLPLSAVQETQEFIHRMRSQMHGGSAGDVARFHLGDGAGGRLDVAALRTEVDQVATDAGRLVSRLVRLVLQLLATEAIDAAPDPEDEPSSE